MHDHFDLVQVGVTPAGGAGAASAIASGIVPVQGQIEAIHLSFATNVTTPNISVVVQGAGKQGPADTFLSVSGSANSGWFYPRKLAQTSAGVAIPSASGGGFVPMVIFDGIALSVSGADAIANAVIARVYFRK